MTAINEILDLLKEVRDEKKKQVTILHKLERSETIFKKYPVDKAYCQGKIESLNNIEIRLKEDLKKAMLLAEIEL